MRVWARNRHCLYSSCHHNNSGCSCGAAAKNGYQSGGVFCFSIALGSHERNCWPVIKFSVCLWKYCQQSTLVQVNSHATPTAFCAPGQLSIQACRHSAQVCATEWTEQEGLQHSVATLRTGCCMCVMCGRCAWHAVSAVAHARLKARVPAASPADTEWPAFVHRHQRHEKQGQHLVDAPLLQAVGAASGAGLVRLVDRCGFTGTNTPNEQKHQEFRGRRHPWALKCCAVKVETHNASNCA